MPKAGKIAIAVIAVVAVVFCLGSIALDRYLLNQTYARQPSVRTPLLLTDDDVAKRYPFEKVEFQLEGGTLRGNVYRCENPRALVVFRHGIFSHHQDYLAIITALVDKGYMVFAYDALGCGESDGDSVRGFAQSPLDVRAAVRFARETNMAGGLPLVLLGHSWGAYGVAGALDFADVRDSVSACVAMSGFDTPNEIISESTEKAIGAAAVTQKPFVSLIGAIDFGADANRSASRAVSECGLPVLVIHGTDDQVIAYEGASIIADRSNISNPLVEYIVKDEPNRNGHNSYFYSTESQAYLEECGAQLTALTDGYDGDLPESALANYLETVDKWRANTADPVLIGEIDSFFTANIPFR